MTDIGFNKVTFELPGQGHNADKAKMALRHGKIKGQAEDRQGALRIMVAKQDVPKAIEELRRVKINASTIVEAHKQDMAPQMILLMGLPAAGKSTFVKKHLQKFYNSRMPHMSSMKILNSDNQLRRMQYERAMRDFAEFQAAGQGGFGQLAAEMRYKSNQGAEIKFPARSFEELPDNPKDYWNTYYKPYYATYFGDRAKAKKLTSDLADKKIGSGDIIILDSTGVNTANFLATFKKAKAIGYTTSVVWLDIAVEHCIARDQYRGETEGRSVGEDVIRTYVPQLKAAYATYMGNSKLVDRFIHFRWQGEVINGDYKLVKDEKNYPRREDLEHLRDKNRKAASVEAANEGRFPIDAVNLASYGFRGNQYGIWVKKMSDEISVTVDTKGKSPHVHHGLAVKLSGWTGDDNMWISMQGSGALQALSNVGRWIKITDWGKLVKALKRYGKVSGDVDASLSLAQVTVVAAKDQHVAPRRAPGDGVDVAAREVIACLLKAGRPDLANEYAHEVKGSAQSAFEKEMLPWLGKIVDKTIKDQLDGPMLKIQQGKWPDRRLEYAVMRHQQASDGTSFLKDVIEHYLAWRRDLARKVSKP